MRLIGMADTGFKRIAQGLDMGEPNDTEVFDQLMVEEMYLRGNPEEDISHSNERYSDLEEYVREEVDALYHKLVDRMKSLGLTESEIYAMESLISDTIQKFHPYKY